MSERERVRPTPEVGRSSGAGGSSTPVADLWDAPHHEVTAGWMTAAVKCAGCGQTWEQPYPDAGTFVCPHCLYGARLSGWKRLYEDDDDA